MKNCSVFLVKTRFIPVFSIYHVLSRIQGITRYENFVPSVLLYCICTWQASVLISGTLGLPTTCGTMMIVMIDDYENRYVM